MLFVEVSLLLFEFFNEDLLLSFLVFSFDCFDETFTFTSRDDDCLLSTRGVSFTSFTGGEILTSLEGEGEIEFVICLECGQVEGAWPMKSKNYGWSE